MEDNIQISSVFEKGAIIDKKGVSFNHDILIKGTVRSKLFCSTKVIVDHGATIIGEVVAGELIVNGTVEGTVYVKGTVNLSSSGRIKGKVNYGDIIIERGSIINGETEKISPKTVSKLFKEPKPAKPATK